MADRDNCTFHVIILGTLFEEYLTNLQLVFDRLQQSGLKLQPKSVTF